ncbi:MAG TPA: Hsp20 family protein [Candidatus Acidoferrales bacterium]|nr:Hsp20 family protein [Candidatus Acidoferrales bacterium]
MTAQSATAMQGVKEAEPVRRKSEETFNQFSALYDLVARRAFELFETRGGSPGHDLGDWLRAESELLHPVPVNVTESDREYIVRAEVPGFCSKDIEISVEPHRLVIFGERETTANGQTIRSEWCADRILRTLDLPSDVDTSKISTALKDGILTVDFPKAKNTN